MFNANAKLVPFPLVFLLAMPSYADKQGRDVQPLSGAQTHLCDLCGAPGAARAAGEPAGLVGICPGGSPKPIPRTAGHTLRAHPPAPAPSLLTAALSLKSKTIIKKKKINISVHLQHRGLTSRPSCVKAQNSSICDIFLLKNRENFQIWLAFLHFSCFLSLIEMPRYLCNSQLR